MKNDDFDWDDFLNTDYDGIEELQPPLWVFILVMAIIGLMIYFEVR